MISSRHVQTVFLPTAEYECWPRGWLTQAAHHPPASGYRKNGLHRPESDAAAAAGIVKTGFINRDGLHYLLALFRLPHLWLTTPGYSGTAVGWRCRPPRLALFPMNNEAIQRALYLPEGA